MIDGIDMPVAKQIVRRLQESDAEAMVGMLQEMFLIKGMVHAAEDLDILRECEAYEDCIYWIFQDELSDTELFEWFRMECVLESYCNDECTAMIRILLEVS